VSQLASYRIESLKVHEASRSSYTKPLTEQLQTCFQ